MEDKLKSLYVDMPAWSSPIKPDDFVVAVGKQKSNSVYHVVQSKPKNPSPKSERMIRYYLKVLMSSLNDCIKREADQNVIPITWYKRKSKNIS